ncbi:MAG: hypothetical protein ACRELC_06255, partial [Gemmatimonadota bacterium]
MIHPTLRERSASGVRLGVAVLGLAILAACGGGDAPEGDAALGGDTAMAADTGAMTSEVAAAATGGLVDPNDATEESLRAVSALPAAGADAILAGRPFENMLALDAALAAHMDSTAREALYRELWIPIDLNTASEEEILLIPGVGSRMAGEFEEYRPYT